MTPTDSQSWGGWKSTSRPPSGKIGGIRPASAPSHSPQNGKPKPTMSQQQEVSGVLWKGRPDIADPAVKGRPMSGGPAPSHSSVKRNLAVRPASAHAVPSLFSTHSTKNPGHANTNGAVVRPWSASSHQKAAAVSQSGSVVRPWSASEHGDDFESTAAKPFQPQRVRPLSAPGSRDLGDLSRDLGWRSGGGAAGMKGLLRGFQRPTFGGERVGDDWATPSLDALLEGSITGIESDSSDKGEDELVGDDEHVYVKEDEEEDMDALQEGEEPMGFLPKPVKKNEWLDLKQTEGKSFKCALLPTTML